MATPSFEPVTLADLKNAVAHLMPGGIEGWAASFSQQPLKNNLRLLGLTSVLFYMAERGRNPKVASIWDATIYCSTCLNVGYGDIFAKTNVGKMVGTLLMTIGPGLNGRVGDAPSDGTTDAKQEQILDTLKKILAELDRGNSADSAA